MSCGRDRRWSPSLISVTTAGSSARCSTRIIAWRHGTSGSRMPWRMCTGACERIAPAEHQMTLAVLDQRARDRHRLGRIVGWPLEDAVRLDRSPRFGGERRPQQGLREVDRRRDQHEAGRCPPLRREPPRGEQGKPAAHRRSDQHLRPLRRGDRREAVLEPRADRAVLEPAARFAMAGIIEAQERAAVLGGPAVERLRLRRQHVRPEPAEPDETGTVAGPPAQRDLAPCGPGADTESLRMR